ncbi:hypothetical protein JCM10296v2_004989 [Rhodotorula toruloides]
MSGTGDKASPPPATPRTAYTASQISLPSSFALITSDGQPVPVDPLVLAGRSRVFADMLTGGQLSGGSCNVSEAKVLVDKFLRVLEGDRIPVDEQGVMKESSWLGLYRMSDKYDCPTLRTILLLEAKQLVDSSPLFAYAAGKLLGDRDLALRAAQRSLEIGKSAMPRFCTACVRPKDQPNNPGYQLQHIWDAAARNTLWMRPEDQAWKSPLWRMWAYEQGTDAPVRACCKAFLEQRLERLQKEFEALRDKHLVRSSRYALKEVH